MATMNSHSVQAAGSKTGDQEDDCIQLTAGMTTAVDGELSISGTRWKCFLMPLPKGGSQILVVDVQNGGGAIIRGSPLSIGQDDDCSDGDCLETVDQAVGGDIVLSKRVMLFEAVGGQRLFVKEIDPWYKIVSLSVVTAAKEARLSKLESGSRVQHFLLSDTLSRWIYDHDLETWLSNAFGSSTELLVTFRSLDDIQCVGSQCEGFLQCSFPETEFDRCHESILSSQKAVTNWFSSPPIVSITKATGDNATINIPDDSSAERITGHDLLARGEPLSIGCRAHDAIQRYPEGAVAVAFAVGCVLTLLLQFLCRTMCRISRRRKRVMAPRMTMLTFETMPGADQDDAQRAPAAGRCGLNVCCLKN